MEENTITCFKVSGKIELDSIALETFYADDFTYCMTTNQEGLKEVCKDLEITPIEEYEYHKVTGKELNWYSIRVPFRQEFNFIRHVIHLKSNKSNLGSIGEVYTPVQEQVQWVNKKKKVTRRCVTPRYVLLQAKNEETIHQILVGANMRVLIQGLVKLDEVKKFKSSFANQTTHSEHTNFVVGDLVNICVVPFNGLSGIIEQVEPCKTGNKYKLKVSVSMLKRKISVTVNSDELEKVSEQ